MCKESHSEGLGQYNLSQVHLQELRRDSIAHFRGPPLFTEKKNPYLTRQILLPLLVTKEFIALEHFYSKEIMEHCPSCN